MLSLVPQYSESDSEPLSPLSPSPTPLISIANEPEPLSPLSPSPTPSISIVNEPGFKDDDIYALDQSNTAEMDAFFTQIQACTEFAPSPVTNDGQIFASPPWKVQGVANVGSVQGVANVGSVMLVFCASLTKKGRKGPQRSIKGTWTVVKTNTFAHVVCARGVHVKCRYAPLSQPSAL